MRVELEGGGWVDARPLQVLKARDRDVVQQATRLSLPIDPETGKLDTHELMMNGGVQLLQRDALIARVITDWSFEFDEEHPLAGQKLPLPTWDGELMEVVNSDSIAELPIDAIVDIENLLRPYQEKMNRRPDPKETTTASSNGTSRGPRRVSRKA